MITRSQALAAGMTLDMLRHAIRSGGPWQRVLPGVYATFSGPLNTLHRLRVAVLYAGDEAVVTGPWGCDMIGLRYGPPLGDAVDVLVGHGRGRGSTARVRLVRTRRMPDARRWVDEERLEDARGSGPPLDVTLDPLAPSASPGVIPMAPAARVVIDTVVRPDRLPMDWRPACSPRRTDCPDCRGGRLHRASALRNVRALMCEVVQRRRASVADLRAEVAAAPRRGGALARLAMRDIDAGCRSAPECELRDLVRRSRVLPEPRWNRVLPGSRGIHPDACWPRARLVVEVDSRSWHGFGDAPRRTEERRARYAALGWRVLPVSPARIRADPDAVLAELEAAYLAGLGR
ncbi:hypothetical protein CLV30_103270 [Haloactinopolyspora alba]|uniref:Very-short-patch-repair endonuclease n=1 Tax=Haloactinopolyspora alba TaxID=648780 RepID=A0A2P8E9J0_9ACTN|nr:hypothetical protein [Haloactinopolyspora alba]PSL06115.1 hypothetical protein CLV30_103270 [Haloactinopolyspora alba]